ncbi:hypothetical protein PS15m_011247 [Mucor circinelloides]
MNEAFFQPKSSSSSSSGGRIQMLYTTLEHRRRVHAKVFCLSIGIYSPIKGHMRCGGSWRAKKHSHYCPIIITNEHNAIKHLTHRSWLLRRTSSTFVTSIAAYSIVIPVQLIPSFDPSFCESKTEKFKTLAKALCARSSK